MSSLPGWKRRKTMTCHSTERGIDMNRLLVKVRMDGDKIGSIQYLELNDTLGICDPAITAIPAAIIESQSTTVDAVSGATRTSQGIIDAVNDALSKLKG